MEIKAKTKETMEVEYEAELCGKSIEHYKSIIFWLSCEMSKIQYGFSERLKQEKLTFLHEKCSYFENELEKARKRYTKLMLKYDKLLSQKNSPQEPEK